MSFSYEDIIHPMLEDLFGTHKTSNAPTWGSGGPDTVHIAGDRMLCLNLDIDNDIEIQAQVDVDSDHAVLIYVLGDLRIKPEVTIRTAHHLFVRAFRLFGDIRIQGTRGEVGASGDDLSGLTAAAGTDRTGTAGRGGLGKSAGLLNHAHPGGRGDDGGSGGPGAQGRDGTSGGPGKHGNDIAVWIERFEGGLAWLESHGGDGGVGGGGESGGHGGHGQRGGPGGQGGSSAVPDKHPGRGGPGGNGGDGGPGGSNGMHGHSGSGGDSGKVSLWVPGSHAKARLPLGMHLSAKSGVVPDPKPSGDVGPGGLPGRRGDGGPGGTWVFGEDAKRGEAGDRDGAPGGPGSPRVPGLSTAKDGRAFDEDAQTQMFAFHEVEFLKNFIRRI